MSLQAVGATSYILCEVFGTTYALRSDEIEQLDLVGQVTPVPNAAPFVDGVVSVRGHVIPAVSLRARFGFPRATHDIRSRLIVVRSQTRTVGLIADGAREFAAIEAERIQPPPDGLAGLSGNYLRGVADLGDRLVLVLDIAALLDTAVLPQSNPSAKPADVNVHA